ncbi:glycine-rich protein [Actinomycetospora sp. CA-084318]|uniref:glycine-rich protein n=1 Tax=Actinomycetospora sp. CA-084318 TaxID=3239892 RepID=UPI003D96A3B0
MRRVSLLSVVVAATLTVAGAGMALAAPTALPDGCAQAGQTVTCTYAFTGGEQSFTVPTGVSSLQVVAMGGAGGESRRSGGQGASASGTVTGLPGGSVLYVEVGSPGGAGGSEVVPGPGGFNGGGAGGVRAGGGGGASDVRTVSRSAAGTLDSRLVVAAGGGGSGFGGGFSSGAGGDAGADGTEGQQFNSSPGRAGTPTAGGAPGEEGEAGRQGEGGSAGSFTDTAPGLVSGGGGGGGGLFGGGAGGLLGGGGGGGSSLVPSGGTVGLSSAAPSVTISYTVPAAPTAAAARGAGTLTATDGQRYSLSVDARATAAGQASGRFAFSGGGAETTASSRTITAVRKTATGSTVTGTAVNAAGRTVPFTLTVVDRAGGRDQVTVQIGGRTVSGTLTNGDITIS